jgi:hypothetical protein
LLVKLVLLPWVVVIVAAAVFHAFVIGLVLAALLVMKPRAGRSRSHAS